MMKYLSLFVFTLLFISCDSKKVVDFETLPESSKLYIQKHFSTTEYKRVVKDRDSALPTFEVLLFNDYILLFDHTGACKRVKGSVTIPVPKSVLSAQVDQFIQNQYFNSTVISWERNATQQLITLSSRIQLYFDLQNNFIKAQSVPFDSELPTLE